MSKPEDKITRSDAEWRQLLSDDAYAVLRHEATERPFSSALNEENRAGHYCCAACGQALFHAESKFDAGCGWPSFSASVEHSLETKADYKLAVPRTEYHCSRCGGHQGHVFNDGPAPSGLRFCNNGVALKFVADDN